MKAKDTILLNKTTTQNPILARRAWFWHVASQIRNYPLHLFEGVRVFCLVRVLVQSGSLKPVT